MLPHSAALHCWDAVHHVVPLAAGVHGGGAITAAAGLCMSVPGTVETWLERERYNIHVAAYWV